MYSDLQPHLFPSLTALPDRPRLGNAVMLNGELLVFTYRDGENKWTRVYESLSTQTAIFDAPLSTWRAYHDFEEVISITAKVDGIVQMAPTEMGVDEVGSYVEVSLGEASVGTLTLTGQVQMPVGWSPSMQLRDKGQMTVSDLQRRINGGLLARGDAVIVTDIGTLMVMPDTPVTLEAMYKVIFTGERGIGSYDVEIHIPDPSGDGSTYIPLP